MRLFTALALITATSCSLNPHRVELDYPPIRVEDTRVFETSFEKPIALAVHTFDDYRLHSEVIGEKRNAWMMHTGEIQSQEPVAEWLRDALALELEDRNFSIVEHSEAGDPPLAVYGEIDMVYSSKRKRTDALVQFTLKLKRGYKILFTRTYRGTASLTTEDYQTLVTNAGAEVDPWGEALARALSQATAPLASDLRGALRREAGIDD